MNIDENFYGKTNPFKLTELIVTIKKKFPELNPILMFVVQREDCFGFSPNFEKDPLYSKELKRAFKEGVLIKAYLMKMTKEKISFIKEVPVILD